MKNKWITLTFVIFLALISIFNVFSPAVTVSFAERRNLKQFDELEAKDFLSGKFMEKFDKIAVDQFIFRDEFRSFKAFLEYEIFRKTDNNGIIVTPQGVFKLESSFNRDSVQRLSSYINGIKKEFLNGNKVYVSIIPDKSHYLKKNILKLDYQALEDLLKNGLFDVTYIDIKDSLFLEAYYLTDVHWKQEALSGLVEQLANVMNFETGSTAYEAKTFAPFYGAYYGQSALNMKPDILTYLWSDTFSNVVVTNYEKNGADVIYDEKKLEGMDAYDVFLSGSSALIVIENPSVQNERELVIFRDSFGSSLAPLLVESYKKITLVDTRYMSKDLLNDYVNFEDAEVLFLYSGLIANHSEILK